MGEQVHPGTVDHQHARMTRLAQLVRDVEHVGLHVPGWLRATSPENRLPVAAAMLAAIVLQLRLPDRYGLQPRWMLPALELALLGILTAINPIRLTERTGLVGSPAS